MTRSPNAVCAWLCMPYHERERIALAAGIAGLAERRTVLEFTDAECEAVRAVVAGNYDQWSETAAGLACL